MSDGDIGIWENLTVVEQEALKRAAQDYPEWHGTNSYNPFKDVVWQSLQARGLVFFDRADCIVTVEDLGLRVLAAGEQPVTPLPSAAGDNTRVLCDWCGQKPSVHGGECDDCWRLPGHEGEGAESAGAVELRAENARLRADLAAAEKREAGLREALEADEIAMQAGVDELKGVASAYSFRMDNTNNAYYLLSGRLADAKKRSKQALANAGTGEV